MKNSNYCCGFYLLALENSNKVEIYNCLHINKCSLHENFRKIQWTANKNIEVLSFYDRADFLHCKRYDGSTTK